jgi:hypothetical protein
MINYETITPQEIFDTVATHLFTQDKQAKDYNSNICLYFDKKTGNKCAIGCLINPDVYSSEYEKNNVYDLIYFSEMKNYIEFSNFLNRNKNLLDILQEVHDDEENWKSSYNMKSKLANVAIYYNLNYDILNNLSFSDR